jgi:hypothetical protein
MSGKTVTQTEYVVRVVTAEARQETNLRLARQFTPAIREAIHEAIQRAEAKDLKGYIGSGRLNKSFRVQG